MRMEDKRSPAFDDTDIMFFGKHEGEPLSDVPAKYLLWAWEETELRQMSKNLTELESVELKSKHPWVHKRLMLSNYIYNSMDALKME